MITSNESFLPESRKRQCRVHMLGKLGLNVLDWKVFRYWRKYIKQNPSSSDEPLMTVMIKTLINIEYSWMRKTIKWLLSARWCMHNWYAEILMQSMAKSQYLSKKKIKITLKSHLQKIENHTDNISTVFLSESNYCLVCVSFYHIELLFCNTVIRVTSQMWWKEMCKWNSKQNLHNIQHTEN